MGICICVCISILGALNSALFLQYFYNTYFFIIFLSIKFYFLSEPHCSQSILIDSSFTAYGTLYNSPFCLHNRHRLIVSLFYG